MIDPAIIEAAARALSEDDGLDDWEDNPSIQEHYRNLACLVLTAVTPMIKAAALERAAQMVENWSVSHFTDNDGRDELAVAIRRLKQEASDD